MTYIIITPEHTLIYKVKVPCGAGQYQSYYFKEESQVSDIFGDEAKWLCYAGKQDTTIEGVFLLHGEIEALGNKLYNPEIH